jgi:hypothetical protein
MQFSRMGSRIFVELPNGMQDRPPNARKEVVEFE